MSPAAAVLVITGVALSAAGCREVEEAAAPVHQAATVTEVPGLDVKQVRFDREGAERISLQTATVRRSDSGVLVPYAALLYDPDGVAWVYTIPAPLTFQRAQVLVDRVVGDLVWVTDGPAPGTRVVTVGSTQLYGAELDIAGGH